MNCLWHVVGAPTVFECAVVLLSLSMVTFLSSPLVLCALALPSDLADPCACTFERDALVSSDLVLTPWFNLHIHGISSIVVRPCLSQHPPLPLPPTSMRGSSGLINLVADPSCTPWTLSIWHPFRPSTLCGCLWTAPVIARHASRVLQWFSVPPRPFS